ncbi:MAG TPA: hypothetical protein VFI61_03555 [Patescibacteria group bacterium]|nr:hypothetical protein [Patescibacteria group bacterium]
METIQIPSTFLTSIKDKYLLLDTNLFRDAAVRPSVFNEFFNRLKSSGVSLITIDLVKYELLKGSSDLEKYKAKEKLINDVVDSIIPMIPQIYSNVHGLIKEYGIEGTAVNITDLFLGAMLMQYKPNIFLITRDTTDFIQRIFDLSSIINVPHAKGIFTYGIYQYKGI